MLVYNKDTRIVLTAYCLQVMVLKIYEAINEKYKTNRTAMLLPGFGCCHKTEQRLGWEDQREWGAKTKVYIKSFR
jgi:hypothetical protein